MSLLFWEGAGQGQLLDSTLPKPQLAAKAGVAMSPNHLSPGSPITWCWLGLPPPGAQAAPPAASPSLRGSPERNAGRSDKQSLCLVSCLPGRSEPALLTRPLVLKESGMTGGLGTVPAWPVSPRTAQGRHPQDAPWKNPAGGRLAGQGEAGIFLQDLWRKQPGKGGEWGGGPGGCGSAPPCATHPEPCRASPSTVCASPGWMVGGGWGGLSRCGVFSPASPGLCDLVTRLSLESGHKRPSHIIAWSLPWGNLAPSAPAVCLLVLGPWVL